MNLTLPTDSNERKELPITSGVLRYFPAALAGVARVSKAGNDKHNPGESLHWSRDKSMDHADCIVRHLMDVQDLLAFLSRHVPEGGYQAHRDAILAEASQLCWRALALSQEMHERFGAPLAPGARLPEPTATQTGWQPTYKPPIVISAVQDEVCGTSPIQGGPPTIVSAAQPGFPVTPGKYRSRNGRVYEVDRIVPGATYPAKGDCYTWRLDGRYHNGPETDADLVERLPDEPTRGAPHPSDPVDYP